MNNNLEIKYVKIENISPSKNNPKLHPTEQIQKIVNSIKQFGFKIPLLIDEKNRIIAGHGRFLAAQKLKMKTIPCIYVNGLKDSEIKTFMIADNKVAESEWDKESLYKIFEIIKEGDKQLLNITGFTESEINNLIINDDYEDLSREMNDLELDHLQTIEWTAKFKDEKEFEPIKNAILDIKKKNGLGCFKSDYSNGKALEILCVECNEEQECNAKALKLLGEKYAKKTALNRNILKKEK